MTISQGVGAEDRIGILTSKNSRLIAEMGRSGVREAQHAQCTQFDNLTGLVEEPVDLAAIAYAEMTPHGR
jgi:hypothetical protein